MTLSQCFPAETNVTIRLCGKSFLCFVWMAQEDKNKQQFLFFEKEKAIVDKPKSIYGYNSIVFRLLPRVALMAYDILLFVTIQFLKDTVLIFIKHQKFVYGNIQNGCNIK